MNELGRIEVASGGWPAGDCNIGAEECAIKWTSYSDIRYIGLRVILPSGVTVFPPSSSFTLSLSLSLLHTLTHSLITSHWLVCVLRIMSYTPEDRSFRYIGSIRKFYKT